MSITYESLRAQWPRSSGQENIGFGSLIRLLDSPTDAPIIPGYQRQANRWTDDQASKFIGFMAEGGDPPVLWVQRWPDYTRPDELLDGLQRCTAVRRFVVGEIPMELADGTKVFLSDMSEKDQRMLLSTSAGPTLTIRYISLESELDVVNFYLRFNRGGSIHTDEDIAPALAYREGLAK